ncbi:Cytochrome c-type biogenesis protein CcmE [Archaeoglobus sulfaticallidus PM70-1]|uniref:Cytochrome c-type biogenesis protein CcmE n=1 Tax=Archaeoglobus sulfaticallidus PM70-1 TaxID=387631 RepID=N0BFJ3_9EURY|nr:cytochrome c maturation protein CcmE [Archaeoglobus sulfaticallidus]AGK61803.1 Cytochrome c-type biogenesis protein CcmE [Archaeoglobus sulfaticallidus PM70-1]
MGNSKSKFIFGFVMVISIIFVYYTLITNLSPYKTVSEVVNSGNQYNIQVNGSIVKNSTRIVDGKTIFLLTDGKSVMEVIYEGTTHNQEDVAVVVTGDYIDGKFYAANVLTKCHTEYVAKKQ